MMNLIADSGSTKTSWRLLLPENGGVETAETQGLNPYYQPFEQIRDEINLNLLSQLNDKADLVDEIHFYGAGCSSNANKTIMKNALEFSFDRARIYVEHDLMGAARALCGHQAGIACILGTGSNSCEYDGKQITRNIPSLGYVLGDEGSGTHMGRLLLSDFLREDMPAEVIDLIKDVLKINKDLVLEKVYQKPLGNRYIAGFVPFIKEHLAMDYFYDLVSKSFRMFFDHYLMLYQGIKDLPVSFTGSISFHMQKVLKDVSEEYKIKLKGIVANPIEGLIAYHQTD